MSASTDTAAPDEPGGAMRYRFADAEFDESEARLRVAGQAVELEPRPLRLLLVLLRHTSNARAALPVLTALQPERLAEAALARDWLWRLQAERGRALLVSGEGSEGLRLIDAALPKLAENGSAAWVQAGYRRRLAGGTAR